MLAGNVTKLEPVDRYFDALYLRMVFAINGVDALKPTEASGNIGVSTLEKDGIRCICLVRVLRSNDIYASWDSPKE